MLELYQFPPHYGIPNLSPFCMKLECYLRMAGIEYTVVNVMDTRKTPKGKCPYIKDGDLIMGDSELIIDHLEKQHNVNVDENLTKQQHALSRALQGMLDERLYWCVVYSRWRDPTNWRKLKELFFGKLPWPMRIIIPKVAGKQVKNQLHGHGMGRHSAEEIYAIGQADIIAVANYLGEKPFFHGDTPARIDACILSYIANILTPELGSPLKDEAENYTNLIAYRDRMMSKYFAD